jgi:aspartyl/asparaginyl beta-hydroxylase (cupin superfamily)
VVPSIDAAKCGINVGSETRAWEAKTPLVFDDSYEHSTWNLTDSSRVILLFDIWHPDLSERERAGLLEMFRHARSQGWLT